MSRMNHHIHPLVDEDTGERRLLNSCKGSKKKDECKSGFPLENEMSPEPFLVCPCIASSRELPHKGPRTAIGVVFPSRNDAWQNAGPPAWLAFFGDNGDVKLPHRLPILPETHEKILLYDVNRTLTFKMQDCSGEILRLPPLPPLNLCSPKRRQQELP